MRAASSWTNWIACETLRYLRGIEPTAVAVRVTFANGDYAAVSYALGGFGDEIAPLTVEDAEAVRQMYPDCDGASQLIRRLIAPYASTAAMDAFRVASFGLTA